MSGKPFKKRSLSLGLAVIARNNANIVQFWYVELILLVDKILEHGIELVVGVAYPTALR